MSHAFGSLDHHRLLVLPKHFTQGVGDFAHGGIGFDGLENGGHEILFGARGLLDLTQRCVDARGVAARAKFPQPLHLSAFHFGVDAQGGQRVVVGVNRYAEEGHVSLPILRIDPEIESAQVERLHKLRARRDASRVQAALRLVEETARSDQDLMPAILEAVKAYATVGEISDALRKVFGEYQESVVI